MAKNIGDERQPVPKSDQVVDMNDLDREATTAVIAAAMTIPVEFYLLDLRYRPAGRHKAPPSDAPLMVWWGPNDRGYGNSLVDKWLGKYTPEQLAAHPEHYRLGVHMLAIPCEMALRVAVPKPKPRDGWGSWCDGPGPVVPNHALLWDYFEDVAWSMDQIMALLKVKALAAENGCTDA